MENDPILLADGRHVKMGRLPPDPSAKALNFASYYEQNKDVLPPPLSVDYAAKASAALRHMYLNDRFGDCVIAGKYHQVGLWTGNDTGAPVVGTDAEVYESYQRICGPGDQGCVITRVLDVMQKSGLMVGGQVHKIDGYVRIDSTSKLEVQVAMEVFGSLTIGINLPAAWTGSGNVWDVTTSRIVGGHDVCCVGYNENGVQVCSWGAIYTITWAAFLQIKWIEECYAQLSPDWFGQDNLAPNGIDAATLQADLVALGQGHIPNPYPFIPPPPPPPPPLGQAPPLLLISLPGVWSGTYRLT